MNWLTELWTGSTTAHAVIILSAVIASGVILGQVRIFGISLGIAGVLFTGLAFGHFQLTISNELIEFAREFGLILFVYTIGMQVGPSFFASFRKQGLTLNMLASAIVLLGVAVAVGLYFAAGLPIAVIVGLLSGAVTNTPGLGAAQQALAERLPGVAGAGELAGTGYAVAYPFGVVGIILSMMLVRGLLRINVAKEAEAFEKAEHPAGTTPENYNLTVTNPRLVGQDVRALAHLTQAEFVISRLLRGGDVVVPAADTTLALGDVLHVVATRENADRLAIIIGDVSTLDVRAVPGDLTARHILITRNEAAGKTIRALNLMNRYGVAITRIHRAGIELVAKAGMTLNFGDRVTVVGEADSMRHVAIELGDSTTQLMHPHILPIFIGIILGVLLGSIPFTIPGIPAPVTLGLAGGPLLVAIVLSRVGKVGPIVWYLPQSANLIVRDIGITLFLACVGLKSGGHYIDTLTRGDGLYWMALASLITLVPLLVVGFVARLVFELNFLSMCGLLAGSMTDPPALSFANQIAASDAPSVTYANVYALVMFLRILTAQALVLLLA